MSFTVTSTYLLDEVTNYYNQRGSDVIVVLLDASKAFDRVNYIHLFNELKTKALCSLAVRFLINMNILQSMCVSWENEKSFNFVASNGVKHTRWCIIVNIVWHLNRFIADNDERI